MTKSAIQKTVTSDRAFHNAASCLQVTAANGLYWTASRKRFLNPLDRSIVSTATPSENYNGHELVP